MKGKGTIAVVAGLVCFSFVLVMFIQFKTVKQTDITSIETMREAELRDELASWRSKYEETAKKLEETNIKINEYTKTSADEKNAKNLLALELSQARTNLGLTDVVGEGVIVTLKDNDSMPKDDLEIYDRRISVYDLLQLFNELKLAGAEAIEINGIRIVNKSDISLIVDSFIQIDGNRLNSPYIVKAIGDQTALKGSLTQKKSGYIDKTIKPYDKIATIETSNQIQISKYNKDWNLKYIEGEKKL